VDNFGDDKQEVLEKLERYQKIKQKIMAYNAAAIQCDETSRTLEIAEANYEKAVNDKIELLQEMGVCPMCNSVVSDETIAALHKC
jgi:hypothetical protein